MGCTSDGAEWRLQLEELERQNRADSLMTNDSLARSLTEYFDRHGSPNERMRAHYILGRTYADRGEAPRAIDAFKDASAMADTLSSDCDYATLARVYTQMAVVFHQQLLLLEEADARREARRFFLCAKDTLNSIYQLGMAAGVYVLLNKCDSAEMLCRKTMQLYEEHGCTQDELLFSTTLMHLYMNDSRHMSDLKELIDRYDSKCEYFNESHELPPNLRQFFFYKGKYFEMNCQLDSAEFYYRRVYRPNMSFVDMNPMYEGLLSVFQKRHQADSIAKYSQLYCQTNDSSIAIKDQELTARLAASYNYNSFQKLSAENIRKALQMKLMLVISAFIVITIFVALLLCWLNYRKRQQQKEARLLRERQQKQFEFEHLKAEFANLTDQYDKNCQTLLLLKENYKATVYNYQNQLDDARQGLADFEAKYNRDIEVFHEEKRLLKEKIDFLSKQEDISILLTQSKRFANTPIVKRMIELANNPMLDIVEKEWDELMTETGEHFPLLMSDLNQIQELTPQEIRATVLVAMNFRTDDIARLLHVSGQRITNMKASLNLLLFGIKSARPFYGNLKAKYGIYLLQNY